MYSSCVVEALDVGENLLSGFGTCLEMGPVYGFFLEICEEAFTPTVISRSPDSREALSESFFGQQIHHLFRCILTAPITVEDAAFGDVIPANRLLDRLNNQIGFHVFGHTLCQDYTTHYVFDLAQIIKSFSRPDVTDIA